MAADKTASMAEAVGRIDPGSTVAAGLALEHAIPFAAGHELIRQGTDDLTLVGPISDVLFDQLVGAGLVSRVRAAWVGNVSAGSGYNFRRAVEHGEVAVENHSNFSIALSLHAAELGVPYLPTRSLLGSDIAAEPQFRTTEDPFEGERIVQVPAIEPDWALVHVQRAAPTGDAHLWGNTGVTYEGVRAADRVVVTAEEVVDLDVITSDPSRTRITREQVDAVVEAPFGAHPSPGATTATTSSSSRTPRRPARRRASTSGRTSGCTASTTGPDTGRRTTSRWAATSRSGSRRRRRR
jgi:glutaconate CoA-transferase subunit A